MTGSVADVVGRDEELSTARSVLREGVSAAVVFRGEAGIGKTTLWEAAAFSLAASGRRVVTARPGESERELSLAAVADLVGPIADEVLPRLPGPQKRALEGALLLRDLGGSVVDPRTLGAALVSSLRIVGGAWGAVLAIDDLQWLDAASRGVVDFVLRRLRSADASALLAVRDGERISLPQIDPAVEAVTVEVGPLSLGALQHVVVTRLGDPLPRPLLRRVHAAVGGNPLYALEMIRALRGRASLRGDFDLPMPSSLADLLRDRIRRLPLSTRRALAAAAALADPRVEVVEREGRLDPAVDDGLVRIEEGVVRFEHPLIASTAYAGLGRRRRRELHARLARALVDDEQRAQHLALACSGPDEAVARQLEEAASLAMLRGAPLRSAELLELALARTADAARGAARRAAAATAYWRAGELTAAWPLASEAVEALPPGPERARMLIVMSALGNKDMPTAHDFLRKAWLEGQGDVVVETQAAARLMYMAAFGGDAEGAMKWMQHAVERIDRLPDDLAASVAADAVFVQLAAHGRPDWELLERGLAAERRTGGRTDIREARETLAVALMLEERYDEAREALTTCIADAEAFGYELRVVDMLNVLSEVEARAGRPRAGLAHVTRAEEIVARLGVEGERTAKFGEYFRVHALAYLGRVDEVRTIAGAGHRSAEESGEWALAIQFATVLGFLELSLGNDAAAVALLSPTAERLATTVPGMHPSHAPVLPNLIEALIGLGRLDEARRQLDRLEARGRDLNSAWALACAYRGRALLAAIDGDTGSALDWLELGLLEHERTGPFERGRTLLTRGAILRRARQWRAARDSLTSAIAIFEETETALWLAKAHAEMARIGGRRRSEGLTSTEERVAKLVAQGMTNKEIAAELFVAVRTVETHLTKIYEKLGIRSRSQLAARLS